MNMQVPPHDFDVFAPAPIRAPRPSPPLRSRLFAGAVTITAHIVAVAAIVAGLHQANILHQPDVVTVQIDVPKQKPEDQPAPLPVPVMVRPSVITAPVPLFDIARPSDPAVAPPPSVPVASPAAHAPSTGLLTPSHAVQTWQGLLLARLQQVQRYPASALARRREGLVVLHFAMDRDGNVLLSQVKKSSGYDLFDQEALALLQRAAPLPKPPAEVANDQLTMDVGVNFHLPSRR